MLGQRARRWFRAQNCCSDWVMLDGGSTVSAKLCTVQQATQAVGTSLGAPSSPAQVMDLLLRELRSPPGPAAGLLPDAPREDRSSGGIGREEVGARLPSGSSGTVPEPRSGASMSMLLRLLGGREPRRSIYTDTHSGRTSCMRVHDSPGPGR